MLFFVACSHIKYLLFSCCISVISEIEINF